MEELQHHSISKADQMMRIGTCTTAALHVLHHDEIYLYQMMRWAKEEVEPGTLKIFQTILWDSLPSLTSQLDPIALESAFHFLRISKKGFRIL